MEGQNEVDLINRDPQGINNHIQVQFEDILAEAEGAYSIPCIWKNSFACFNCGKNLCYRIMTTLCGLCIALFWGCDFAMVAFDHVWCYTPCIRDLTICVGCFQKVFGTLIGCCCNPICDSCARIFGQIKVSKS